MTDSLEIQVNLKSLSPESRKAIDYDIGSSVSRNTGELKQRYIRPTAIKSALAGTGMSLQFKADGSLGPDVPTAVSTKVNVPNATMGQNYVHGMSVPLAAAAALGLVMVHLAEQGVTREDLAKLDESVVTLPSLTLTYLIDAESQAGAAALMADLASTLKLLDGNTLLMGSGNASLYLQKAKFAVKAYNKTDESNMAWPPGAPNDLIRQAGQRLVRIEVVLRESFLTDHGMTSPAGWKASAGRAAAKKVWGLTVAKVFRLDDNLRHRAPRDSVVAELTPQAQKLLRGYLLGKDPRKFVPIAKASSVTGKLHKLRAEILKKMQVDINIPWVHHQALKNFELKALLASPPKFRVPDDLAPWCFCKANWPSIRARLDSALEDALKAHKEAQARVSE